MYGDPDHLDALAVVLRDHATEIRADAWDHMRGANSAQWVSAAAEAYRQEVYTDRVEANAAADDIDSAADTLNTHAQTVRERIAAIAAAEQAVRDWVSRQAEAVADTAQAAVEGVGDVVDAIVPSSLPSPGSVEWLDLGSLVPWGDD